MIVPDLGPTLAKVNPSGLADALFTPVQQIVLGLLFGQPERRFQSAELIRLAGSGTGAVHRQLQRLAEAELITVEHEGNQKYYRANTRSAVFPDLQGLVRKTVGLVGPLRDALQPLAKRVVAAFVFGSIAKGKDRAGSDIDVVIVSDRLDYADLYRALQKAESRLARSVNPTLMTFAEWKKKSMEPDSFAARIAAQPRVFVLGDADALA
jgi:predicted nucleotidyltransferase